MARNPRSPRDQSLAEGVPRGVPIAIATGTAELVDESDGSVTVYVNGVPSSSLRADYSLDFEYMRHEAAAIAAWDRSRDDHAWLALHVGAAACSLPRHLANAHAASRHIAVDVDVTLAELARRWWDLPRAPRLRVRAQDGLAALAERADASLDLIVRDAFAGDSVPSHLASADWWAQARSGAARRRARCCQRWGNAWLPRFRRGRRRLPRGVRGRTCRWRARRPQTQTQRQRRARRHGRPSASTGSRAGTVCGVGSIAYGSQCQLGLERQKPPAPKGKRPLSALKRALN